MYKNTIAGRTTMMRAVPVVLAALAMLSIAGQQTRADDISIAQQYGISYLPLIVMKERDLLVARGKADGIAITPHWLSFTGGAPMNEALISGNLDIASGGVAPMLLIWDRTKSSMGVRALAALESLPLYLTSTNPAIKTLKDFKASDRIALPAAKVSIQAIVLAMGAAQALGPDGVEKLNNLTVSMAHPDGMSSMMNGTAGITAHFTSPPYQYQELEDPKVHRVLNSYDVLGGPHTFNVAWASKKFVEGKPKLVKAFLGALEDAEAFIHDQPAEAAKIYVASEKSTLSAAAIEKMIRDPEVNWTMRPQRILEFGTFMQSNGLIRKAPTSVADVFFPGNANVLGAAGGDNAGKQ
jgi:NitT/TauT family transport system substrate-binding protein